MPGAEKAKPPQDFFCPVTSEIMLDPVETAGGETFERAAIENWFRQGNITSPITKAKLASSTLTPNKSLKRSISKFLEEQTTRVKDLQAKHVAAYRELRSYGPAAAALIGDDQAALLQASDSHEMLDKAARTEGLRRSPPTRKQNLHFRSLYLFQLLNAPLLFS